MVKHSCTTVGCLSRARSFTTKCQKHRVYNNQCMHGDLSEDCYLRPTEGRFGMCRKHYNQDVLARNASAAPPPAAAPPPEVLPRISRKLIMYLARRYSKDPLAVDKIVKDMFSLRVYPHPIHPDVVQTMCDMNSIANHGNLTMSTVFITLFGMYSNHKEDVSAILKMVCRYKPS